MTFGAAALFWLSTYFQVLVYGLQSRNVNTGQYIAAGCTSILIGASQLVVVRAIVINDPLAILALTSTAGPLGIMSSMWLHRRLFKRRDKQ